MIKDWVVRTLLSCSLRGLRNLQFSCISSGILRRLRTYRGSTTTAPHGVGLRLEGNVHDKNSLIHKREAGQNH